MPVLAAVGGTEDGCVFYAGIDGIGLGERRLEVPDALELPGVLRAVVPLMRGERLAGIRGGVVGELVALGFGHAAFGFFARGRARLMPGLAAVVGALEDLAKPSAGLRSVNAVGIGGRALQVIHLPAGKMRPADFPVFAFA